MFKVRARRSEFLDEALALSTHQPLTLGPFLKCEIVNGWCTYVLDGGCLVSESALAATTSNVVVGQQLSDVLASSRGILWQCLRCGTMALQVTMVLVVC